MRVEQESEHHTGPDEIHRRERVIDRVVREHELLSARVYNHTGYYKTTDFGKPVDVVTGSVVREIAIHPQDRHQAREKSHDVAFHHVAGHAGHGALVPDDPCDFAKTDERQNGRHG